ncbi:hypothetical protein [Marinicella meishanensis]|uniref:hypothetical protein n=1 Tax=Marinicella meishanensis TaxID=2873263 RepID=UPI001CBFC7C3|nr:hypothetical protein [Marinicella sp. NBU2979]
MKLVLILAMLLSGVAMAQVSYPLNEATWDFHTKAHVFEAHHGEEAVEIADGLAVLKEVQFLNGTIEFDVFLSAEQSFPGIRFRGVDKNQMESFFLRPHLTGKPDANQAAPVIGGLTAWQLYFGPSYSFPYDYRFDAWTHVKLVVNDNQAQVFLDHAKTPHLSWYLKHKPQAGFVGLGGGFAPAHFANVTIDEKATDLVNFDANEVPKLASAVGQWDISDKFMETELADLDNLENMIEQRVWPHKMTQEERGFVNISWDVIRYGSEGDTVFARVLIESERDQYKRFEFGFSDRAVVLLNGKPLYKGSKKWRSRDYRYLGTVGFHDSVYLPLKKGQNTLLLAVTEDFGGWLVGGQFSDQTGIRLTME